MSSALLYSLAQRLPFREQMLLTEKTIQRSRAYAIRQRAMQCVVPIRTVDILCE